jgi:TatD DNase family protein
MCKTISDYNLFCTAGIHPTQCNELEGCEDEMMFRLEGLINSQEEGNFKIVALGECGLDYDRLEFCKRDQQIAGFKAQLELASRLKKPLPLFLHNRNTNGDFLSIITENREKIPKGGVVHSFDGNLAEMHSLIDLGFYIGINGCSLKTQDNLDVIKEIPSDRILIETDSPWCGIKSSHASFKDVITVFPSKKPDKYEANLLVKDRNEPCCLIQVLEVLAAVRQEDIDVLASTIFQNTETLFFSH